MRERLIAEDPRSEEILKPVLRGRDIARYRANWDGLWLIDTHNGYAGVPPINVDDYPAVKAHLDRFIRCLERRQDKGVTPYNLRNCAYHAKFADEKLVWIELAERGRFAYDDTGVFGEATTFVLTGEHLKFLCAVLNSNALQWYISHHAPTSGTGDLRWKKVYVETIPIPRLSVENQRPFVELVDRIIAAKHSDPDADIKADEEQIDRLVYALYGFTEQENISLSGKMPGARTWNNL